MINISIKALQIELTPALKDYTEKRFAVVEKYTGEGAQVQAEVGKTTDHHRHGEIFRAEVNVTDPLGRQYRAVSEKADLYEAIDDARDDLVRSLTSVKGKTEALWKRGARKMKNLLRGFRS